MATAYMNLSRLGKGCCFGREFTVEDYAHLFLQPCRVPHGSLPSDFNPVDSEFPATLLTKHWAKLFHTRPHFILSLILL